MPVFFTGRYLVLGEPRLVRRTITDGDEIILVQALGKRVKAVRPVATCLYYDLIWMARWRVQAGYAYESFDD